METTKRWSISINTNGVRRLADGTLAKTGHIWIQDGDGRTVVDTEAIEAWPLSDANRRLIESAAQLLAAAKAVINYTGYGDRDRTTIPEWDSLLDAVRVIEGR